MTYRAFAVCILGAVSFAACAAPDEADAQSDDADLTSSWPAAIGGKSCINPTAAGGHHARIRFVDGNTQAAKSRAAYVELYEADTGELVKVLAYELWGSGDELTAFRGTGTSAHVTSRAAVVVRKLLDNGEVAHSLRVMPDRELDPWLGGAEIPLTCDIDPGSPALKNPAASRQAYGDLQTVGADLPATIPAGATCLSVKSMASAPRPSRRARIAFERASATDAKARLDIYDAETGFFLETQSWSAKRDASGGYKLFETSSSGNEIEIGWLRPANVAGRTVMALEAKSPRLADAIGGVLPIECDFL